MNQQDRFATIDERGRGAAAALRGLLDSEDAVDDTDDRAVVTLRTRRNPLPYLLAAAAAIVVVLGAAIVATRDDDPSPVVSGPSINLLPDTLPPGLEPNGILSNRYVPGESGDGASQVFEGDGAVYAGDSTMNPPAITVMVVEDGPDPSLADNREREVVRVQGSDAIISMDGPTGSRGGGLTLSWERSEGRVFVTGVGLTREQIVAAAEAAEFDGVRPSIPTRALPDGLSLQHRDRANALSPFGGAYALAGSGAGVIGYSDATYAALIVLSTGPGDQRRVDALRPLLTDPRSVEVRDTEGIVSAGPDEPLTLTWLEKGNTVVRLYAYGVTEADLVAMAESLRPVTAAEFSRAIPAAPEDSFAVPADADLVAEVDGGTLYVVIDEPGESIAITFREPSVAATGYASTIDLDTAPIWFAADESRVFGLVGEQAVRGVVIDAGGSFDFDLIDVPGHPAKAFAVPVGSSAEKLEFYDEAGNLLTETGA